MFTKTMQFDDLDGNTVEQTFYFNYNKKEIAELLEFGAVQEFAEPDKEYVPLEEAMKQLSMPVEESGLSKVENNRRAYRIFQDLLLDAYGQKTPDNRGFVKSRELRDYWKNHSAFVELVFEFLADPQQAATFIEKCLPPRMVAQAKVEMEKESGGKLSSQTLAEMVDEANRRQQDPETRIEPGPEAAANALGENQEVADLASAIKKETSAKRPEDLTAQDIESLSEEDFGKLDPRRLSKDALMASFQRKTRV